MVEFELSDAKLSARARGDRLVAGLGLVFGEGATVSGARPLAGARVEADYKVRSLSLSSYGLLLLIIIIRMLLLNTTKNNAKIY